MRKLILHVAVSLDSFIEGPKGEFDWCFTDQDYGMAAFFKSIDAIFMGRKSYELVQSMKGQNPWKGMKTYVFSNSLREIKDKEAVLICGDIRAKVESLKKESGKDIWLFGGASLTASLMNEGLVDGLVLAVHPILLGQGKPLFQGVKGRVKTTLTSCQKFDTGLVMLNYQVAPITKSPNHQITK
jgi:dihydrofolate reductase